MFKIISIQTLSFPTACALSQRSEEPDVDYFFRLISYERLAKAGYWPKLTQSERDDLSIKTQRVLSSIPYDVDCNSAIYSMPSSRHPNDNQDFHVLGKDEGFVAVFDGVSSPPSHDAPREAGSLIGEYMKGFKGILACSAANPATPEGQKIIADYMHKAMDFAERQLIETSRLHRLRATLRQYEFPELKRGINLIETVCHKIARFQPLTEADCVVVTCGIDKEDYADTFTLSLSRLEKLDRTLPQTVKDRLSLCRYSSSFFEKKANQYTTATFNVIVKDPLTRQAYLFALHCGDSETVIFNRDTGAMRPLNPWFVFGQRRDVSDPLQTIPGNYTMKNITIVPLGRNEVVFTFTDGVGDNWGDMDTHTQDKYDLMAQCLRPYKHLPVANLTQILGALTQLNSVDPNRVGKPDDVTIVGVDHTLADDEATTKEQLIEARSFALRPHPLRPVADRTFVIEAIAMFDAKREQRNKIVEEGQKLTMNDAGFYPAALEAIKQEVVPFFDAFVPSHGIGGTYSKLLAQERGSMPSLVRLENPHFLTWCLALISKEDDEKVPMEKRCTIFCDPIDSVPSGYRGFRISLKWMLNQIMSLHPILLETVTPRRDPLPIESYIRRKKSLPPFHGALSRSGAEVRAQYGLKEVAVRRPLDLPYNPHDWVSYRELYKNIVATLRQNLPLQANDWHLYARENDFGFSAMLEDIGGSPDEPLESLAKKFANSIVSLEGAHAYKVFDRYHFTRGLLEEFPNQLFAKTIDLLANPPGVTPENAIMAEQLYVRLRWVQDWYNNDYVANPRYRDRNLTPIVDPTFSGDVIFRR